MGPNLICTARRPDYVTRICLNHEYLHPFSISRYVPGPLGSIVGVQQLLVRERNQKLLLVDRCPSAEQCGS
jgi:hypothetical protein